MIHLGEHHLKGLASHSQAAPSEEPAPQKGGPRAGSLGQHKAPEHVSPSVLTHPPLPQGLGDFSPEAAGPEVYPWTSSYTTNGENRALHAVGT